jgi:hypothetical protein
MSSHAEVGIVFDDADDDVIFLRITTPIGVMDVCGELLWVERVLYVHNAHVQGLQPGDLLRAGLNAIGRKLLDVANVDKIVIQGANRTTGRRKGCAPKPISFPHD